MDETMPSRKQFSPAPPTLVPYDTSPRRDEDEEAEETDEETAAVFSSMDLRIQPPIKKSQASAALSSRTGRRRVCKRKKVKGKRKSMPSAKKQRMVESMLQILRLNLNPVPFIPRKTLDFAGHESLLKKLGLWEFVHIDFDRSIRVEFIAQLVANYDAKSRASHVNGRRIRVNRADLAHACKLPLQSKMDKSNEDWDWEVLSDDSIRFVLGVLSDRLLLHEDMYLIPQEVALWLKMIRKGHPEKVDWAGLLWLMVEKELTQGSGLRDCYYASHLQHLIKFQHKKLFLIEEPVKNVVELVNAKEIQDVVYTEDSDEEGVKDFEDEEVDFLQGDGSTGSFLRGMEGNQMGVRLRLNPGKRAIEQEVSDSRNKRMRMNETTKPLDFGMCMDQIQEMSQRARMLYEEEKGEWGTQREMLLNEVQKRDDVIAHLRKGRMEETQKKEFAIKRLERELYMMRSVVDGYRKALKESRVAFAKAGLAQEATYKVEEFKMNGLQKTNVSSIEAVAAAAEDENVAETTISIG